MKSSVGSFELDVPDRNGSSEPQIVKKHQTNISEQIEEKILSLYGLGNSYQQIVEHWVFRIHLKNGQCLFGIGL